MTVIGRTSRARKIVGALAIAGAAAVALSACTGGSVTGNSSGGSGKTQLTLWWNYTGTSAKSAQSLIDGFNKSQSKYQVTAQFGAPSDQFDSKLINAIKNKQGPNIVLGDSTPQNIGQVVQTGQVLPLEPYLGASSSTITKDDFTAGMLSTGTFNGTLYTLPTDVGDYAMVYNKQMFKDAGITSPPKTWADLAADAKKLTKGTSQYGIYLPISSGEWPVFTWESTLWSAGGQLLSSDNSKVEFNSPQGVQALTAWVDMIKNGSAYPQSLFTSTNNGGTAAVTAKKAAMTYDGAYDLSIYDQSLGANNVGVFPVPGISQPAMNLGTDNSYMLKGSKAQEQGEWQFLEYWLKPSVQAKWDVGNGFFPSSSKTSTDPTWTKYLAANPNVAQFVSELSYAKARPSITSYGEVSTALSNAITSAMMGKASPQQALNTAAQTAQAALTSGH